MGGRYSGCRVMHKRALLASAAIEWSGQARKYA